MYAIAFDLDTNSLRTHYDALSYNNAYADVKAVLSERGFLWQQGSVYFGNAAVTPVSCVLAVQAIAQRYAWFAHCVRDIRMMRIEENNDLGPAIAALS